jgi:superfamily II DNA or RNA helicase
MTTKKTLREDQTKFINDMRVALRKTRRIIAKAPTGYGKTLVAATIIESARAKDKKVLFTVPLISLVDQTVQAFYAQGIKDVGVIQADHPQEDWSKPVQVASIDTLMSRCTERYNDGEKFKRRLNFEKFPQADVILLDEVHRWSTLYEAMTHAPELEKVPIIGVSATPWTKGLGAYFEELVPALGTREMVDAGLLSPFKVWAPAVHPDMEGVRSTTTPNGRDFVEEESAERMSRPEIVADVIDTWMKRADGRPTLLFAVTCAHAKLLQQRFLEAGIKAAYQDANTPTRDHYNRKIDVFTEGRDSIKEKFHKGDYQIVCNVGTLTMGCDWDVRCISLCRPTRSEMLYVQIVGRGLRPANGKDHLLLLDHSDSTLRLGFVDEIDAWHNEGLHNGRADPKSEGETKVRLPKECPNCGFIKRPGLSLCPNCGTVTEAHAPPIDEQDGELQELTASRRRRPRIDGDRQEIYAGLLWLQRHKRRRDGGLYAFGWIGNKYKEIFGVWPRGMGMVQPQEPSAELVELINRGNNAYRRKMKLEEAKADNRFKLGEINGNGHALTERQQTIIDNVRQQHTPGTLMTEEDWNVKW